MPSAGDVRTSRPHGFHVGEWLVHPDLGLIEGHGGSRYLRPQVMDLLLLLARSPGSIVSKEEIIDAIWHRRFTAESSLTRAVAELRKALGDSPQPAQYIENHPKRGYRLVAEVHPVEDAAAAQPSLAVLPLESPAGEPDPARLGEGISEAIITILAGVAGLAVMARTSSFAAELRSADPREVGRTLGVQYVLDGSVRREQGIYRITILLVEAESGRLLWTERFDRMAENLFALEDEIARLTLANLQVALSPDEQARLASGGTSNSDAHALHRLGRYHLGQRTPSALVEAIRCFEQALARDGGYAAAWSGMADAFSILGFLGFAAPDETYPRVRDAAQRALELDPGMGEAFTSLAAARGIHERDWRGACDLFAEGCRLAPQSSHGHLWYGIFLALLGRFDEAWVELQAARRLDPLSLPVLANIGLLFYFMGRNDEAAECHRHVLALDPHFPLALVHLGRALLHGGDAEEAIVPLQSSAATGFTWAMGFLGMALGRAGRSQEARHVLAQFERLETSRYVSPLLRACVHLGLGEHETACGQVEAALGANDPLLAVLRVDPLFNPLRAHPRFVAVMEALAFPA